MTPAYSRIAAANAAAPRRSSPGSSPLTRSSRSAPSPSSEDSTVASAPYGSSRSRGRNRSATWPAVNPTCSSGGTSSRFTWPTLPPEPDATSPSAPPGPNGNRSPTRVATLRCTSAPRPLRISSRRSATAASTSSTASAVACAVEPGGRETCTATRLPSNAGDDSNSTQPPPTREAASANPATPRARVANRLWSDQRSAGR